ncbi:MAG: exodeoxyribonuclease VII small subunit [Deltaproteobacteria bacterium]|nr:exodeoxyribonuclease VII small subunit [Deltaproteobacteria bacterium]
MAAKKESFEKVLEKLDGVVRDLEEGGLPLEDALSRFEQGVRLSREGAKRLEEAERRIEEILDDGTVREIDTKDEES